MPEAPQRIVVSDGHVIVGEGGGVHVTGQGMPPGFPMDVPPNAANVAYMFFVTIAVIAIGIPLARAFGRWLDRRWHRRPAPEE